MSLTWLPNYRPGSRDYSAELNTGMFRADQGHFLGATPIREREGCSGVVEFANRFSASSEKNIWNYVSRLYHFECQSRRPLFSGLSIKERKTRGAGHEGWQARYALAHQSMVERSSDLLKCHGTGSRSKNRRAQLAGSLRSAPSP